MDGLALGSKGGFMVRQRTGSPGQERSAVSDRFEAGGVSQTKLAVGCPPRSGERAQGANHAHAHCECCELFERGDVVKHEVAGSPHVRAGITSRLKTSFFNQLLTRCNAG